MGRPAWSSNTARLPPRSKFDTGKTAERRTRQVQRGRDIYWQVELPAGSWLDCAGDCAEKYRREELNLWQTKKEESR